MTDIEADSHGYWRWRDALLRHPDGRAVGGEPCVKCGAAVPPNAHWTHRDRHVCGSRCNSNLGRQINRQIRKGADLPVPAPPPMQDPRVDPSPQVFATVTPVSDELPYQFDGFGPREGDVVERHGEFTSYIWLRPDEMQATPEWAPQGLFVAVHESGHKHIQAASKDGLGSRMVYGAVDPSGERRSLDTFEVDGERMEWAWEFIRDVTPDGREYTWEAVACVPVAAQHPHTLWSPAFSARSAQKRRVSSSTARHVRRQRTQLAQAERFDPVEIFERDGWICQLCTAQVDPVLKWPDLQSASLDHVVPLAAHGQHSRDNTQLAHWLCNVRKGASTPDL